MGEAASLASTGRTRTGMAWMRVPDCGITLLLPALLLEALVLFVPLLYVAGRSFYDWEPAGVSTFVGFKNYQILFADPEFWQVVGNQIFYLLGLPLWVIAPLVVAYMLREGVWRAGLFRSIYFLPAVMSPAIVGLVFRTLLATDGPVNAVLESVGLGFLAAPWLTEAQYVKPVVILLVLWAGFGTGVLIFSAAFAAVPQQIFEAARLDGAGFWQEFWHIAVPSVRPTVFLWAMFQIVSIFLFMFGWIYVLTSGGPGLASATMDFSIYQQFMRFGFYGTAAAQSVALVAAIVLVPIAGAGARAVVTLVTRARPPRHASVLGAKR